MPPEAEKCLLVIRSTHGPVFKAENQRVSWMDYVSILADSRRDSEIAIDMPCSDATQSCFPAPCVVSKSPAY